MDILEAILYWILHEKTKNSSLKFVAVWSAKSSLKKIGLICKYLLQVH